MVRSACVAIAKNEANNIAEWIAFQISIGFDSVIIYDNCSSDNTVSIIEKFSKNYDVKIINWPENDNKYQINAYNDGLQRFGSNFEWIAFFDVDEFLVINRPLDLKSLLRIYADGSAAAIGIPWAIFGSSGHISQPYGLIIDNFIQRSNENFGPNRHVKSIVKPVFTKCCHQPHTFEVNGDYIGLNGKKLELDNDSLLKNIPDYSFGKLNHYFTKSKIQWMQKLKRGYHDIERLDSDFSIYDVNDVNDRSACRYRFNVLKILKNIELNIDRTNNFSGKKIGIGITTFNRFEVLKESIRRIKNFTSIPCEIFVADDGSIDNTLEFIPNEDGIYYFSGRNRGVAWNKNRCLFFFRNFIHVDVIILLDDDVHVDGIGWEQNFVNGAIKYGHINYAFPDMIEENVDRRCDSIEPGITRKLGGPCIAFSHPALDECGYFDSRFLKFGHEHTEFTKRLVSAGYGGINRLEKDGQATDYFFVVRSDILFASVTSTGNDIDIANNARIWDEVVSKDGSLFRSPWSTLPQKIEFLAEQRQIAERYQFPFPFIQAPFDEVAYGTIFQDIEDTSLSPWRHFVAHGLSEGRNRLV
ncbi:glycosyltransferase [Acidiphilium multivorum]|uniref:glycosyltransferase family 2 protein n=1 Tax=Acidiphilium multivorum TaxID=62140 RepID=UPI001F4BD93C|nr:glycosyltransferase [Acidiphilium multivorum]UNC13136.1 glycosyltransferase [Acidiphilium multivorum]